jgi:hypothetical protein
VLGVLQPPVTIPGFDVTVVAVAQPDGAWRVGRNRTILLGDAFAAAIQNSRMMSSCQGNMEMSKIPNGDYIYDVC